MFMFHILNTVIGAQRRLASLGNKVELEYGHPIDRLFRETIRVIVLGLRALRGPPSPNLPSARKLPRAEPEKRFFVKLRSCMLIALCATLTSLVRLSIGAPSGAPRLELAADSRWKFLLGDPSGAEAPSFADGSWRTLDLPHDWSIEGRPIRHYRLGVARARTASRCKSMCTQPLKRFSCF
jgi:hypothetical protein